MCPADNSGYNYCPTFSYCTIVLRELSKNNATNSTFQCDDDKIVFGLTFVNTSKATNCAQLLIASSC
jgi:hypothetical protein